MKRLISALLALALMVSMLPRVALATMIAQDENTKAMVENHPELQGKTVSILGDSISTMGGVSNNTAYNSTIGSNAVYYGANGILTRADTWWQQTIDALGMELLVNNSWSGSCVLHTRSGTVGAYADRCIQLHNDHTGEEPDVIVVFLGTNDFSYYQSALGTANIDYDKLITDNGNGRFTYATPVTTCEAYAVMLHKMVQRYPDAEVYCMTLLPRRATDYPGDSITDVGAPTAFNAELAKIIAHFGATLVDLENCGITSDPANFDLYMKDKRVHPNGAGMDRMSEALVSAMLGSETKLYNISGIYSGVVSDNSATVVVEGKEYTAKISSAPGYSDLQVTVTMGGVNVTETAYVDGTIYIETVTGDVEITAKADRTPMNFCWEHKNGDLVSVGDGENTLTKLAGSTTDEVFTDTRYQMQITALLRHDLPWVLEWKGSGSGGFMLSEASGASSAPFFFRRAGNYLNAFGDHDGSRYNNYGLALNTTDIDGSALHIYRLENRIATDGSNMVYMLVDGVEIGALNHHYVAGTSQNATGDWISGKDFMINYIGTPSHPLTNYAMEYLLISECVHTYESGICTACGADARCVTEWLGASAVFLGDSITYGVGTDKTYHAYIDARSVFQSVQAMGVAGSCISSQSDYGSGNSPLIYRYTSIPNADLIVIFMGTNDYGHETPLGSATDTADISFYGALNVIIPGIQTQHPDSQLVFVTPLHRYGFGSSKILDTQFTYDHIANGRGHTLSDYVDAIKVVCEKYSVPVIDLFNEYPVDPSDSADRVAYIPDGLHPNSDGHEIIADLIFGKLQNIPRKNNDDADKENGLDTEDVLLQHGNKFVSNFANDATRASSISNLYLSKGQTVTFILSGEYEWALAKTDSADSTDYSRYYPENGWNSAESYIVAEDGYYGLVLKKRDGSTFDFKNQDSNNAFDYISVDNPDEHQHTYTATVTKPTCTEHGYTTYTCSCGDSYVSDYVDSLGHIYENGVCTGCGEKNPNPYAGKTIACIGDSITYGVGVTRDETDYVTLLAQSMEMDYIRLGASGTTLCTDGHATCNIGKLTEENLAGADVVTILMGINDFVQARGGYYKLGSIESTDTSTIYGAAHMWCQRIVELRKTDSLKDTKFYFLTPVITSWNNSVSSTRNWDQGKQNVHGYTLRDLCNAILEVCALYDIPVIDLNLVSGLYYNSAEDNTVAEFGGDGAHPGTVGHQMMADAIENRLLQNHLRDDHEHRYGSWVTTTYPDCVAGEQQRVCSVCTATEKQKLDGTGHTYENGVCTNCGEKETLGALPLGSGLKVTVTPANYAVVSNTKTENLACAPCLVSYGEGKFAVAYLTDEVNKIETEASTTIVCRVALFDPEHPEQAEYLDIATAGQTIGDVTIGSKAPYEPNLLALADGKLLAIFNLRSTTGKYIYYSACIDPDSRAVTAYAPLTLDGKEWVPANVASSYNALTGSNVSAPSGSMVFTSKIIEHDGYYYGYCGGISSGFAGILVRSTDGINWTSVMAPQAASDMAGVIECGFGFIDEYVYFCMRDISSGVYQCAYNFTTGQQLTQTEKLPELTTSKTDVFRQDGKLYIIVNKATDDDSSVGRRNTARIYAVKPETCELTLVKELFCADGIAYHSVLPYKGNNYWCFHTDARRIEPYTQGRSNLALMEMPALTTACDENGILQRDRLSGFVTSGCITAAANQWQAGVVNLHYQLPITCFTGYDTVTITANAEQKAYVAFFHAEMKRSGDVAYADGWTNQVILEPGETRTFKIPADAQYLYILNNNAAGNDLFPAEVRFYHDHSYTSTVTAPTCTKRGYTTYTCAVCGDSYVDDYVDSRGYDWMLEDGEFKILLIGNSFSEDASNAGMPNSQMLDILQAMLGDDVKITVGLCYSGGKGLNWHATQSEQGNSSYSLRIISTESGKWTSLGSYTSADALKWTDWDVVSLQHYEINTTTGKESNAYPTQVDPKFDNLEAATEFMLDYADSYAPNAAIYFYMHWARAYKSNLNESLATYNKMAEFFPVVMDYKGTESGRRFETIIPVGLSVQNARTTYLSLLSYNTTAAADGNLNLTTDAQIGLQRDGGHLSYNIGRYIAALTFAEMIIPEQMRTEGYVLPDIRITESVGKLPKEYTEIAQKAVKAAVAGWKNGSLAVTNIEGYEKDPTTLAGETLESITLELACAADISNLTEKIKSAVLAVLSDEFTIDTVSVTSVASYGSNFSCEVTIRFGYTSLTVTVDCAVSVHDYYYTVTKPTCTEQGYTTYTCSCGDSYVSDYVDSLGHIYVNGVCTGCGAVLGDLNADGDVDAEDLTILARHVAGIEILTEETALSNGDVDGNGRIDAEDLTMLARYVAGIITGWKSDE